MVLFSFAVSTCGNIFGALTLVAHSAVAFCLNMLAVCEGGGNTPFDVGMNGTNLAVVILRFLEGWEIPAFALFELVS